MQKFIFVVLGLVLLGSLSFAQEVEMAKVKSANAYLSDLTPSEANSVYYVDQDPDSESMLLGDIRYEKGICMLSDSQIKFKLGGKYREFSAVVGIGDKHSDYLGKLVFKVYADAKEVYASKELIPNLSEKVKLSIAGADELILEVKSSGEITDFAMWADAAVAE